MEDRESPKVSKTPDSELEKFAKKNKSKKKIAKYIYISGIFLSVIIFAIVCFVCFFKVKTVIVEGAQKYSDDLIIIKSGITVGENLYSYKQSEIEEKLMLTYPYISRVRLSRRWPDKIVLKVSEDTPKYAANIYGETLIFSDSVRILEHTESSAESTELCILELPDIDRALVGNKPVFTLESKYVEQVLEKVGKSPLANKITYINLESKFDIYLLMGKQYKIKCGNAQDFDVKLNVTEKILNSGHIPDGVKAEINVSNPDECTAIIGEEAKIQ